MSKIDDKFKDLKNHGLDLGAAQAAEEDAGSGGRVRRYANGNIYYHPNTGAHEVHGGILGKYLAVGGPGANPANGQRNLGYPTSDELKERPPRSLFEWGAIYWTQGTGGAVLWGSLWETYKAHSELGLPITGNMPLAGGMVAYFERGVLFSANGGGNVKHVLIGEFHPPLMGRPYILDTDDEETRRFRNFCVWRGISKEDYNALVAWRASIFTDIWKDRLYLSPVGQPNTRVPLSTIQVTTTSDSGFYRDMVTVLEAFPNGPTDIANRTLYDLRLKMANGDGYAISPHCIYAKKDWTDFGLMHITDLHVAERNDGFRGKLAQLGLSDASQHYTNFQDNFRDFVKYANKLHALGAADAVMATGDLIDYVEENGDELLNSNFGRLRRLILGQAFDSGDPVGEELKIPIFVTFGNHDYRIAPYDLASKIDVPILGGKDINEFSGQNLIQSDAIALQGGKVVTYGVTNLDGALRMAQWDRYDNKYWYFKKYFTPERSYVVKLGPHRLVVLDTKYDEGVPAEANLDLMIKWITDSLPSGTAKFLAGGSPSSHGLDRPDLNMLSDAVRDAGQAGLVIVGMHCPAMSPKGGEYPYYLRETIHPTADPALTDQYVARNGLNGASWPRSGTGYFKTGGTSDGMDNGAIAYGGNEFLNICAGVGVPRPVDLVLYGHIHDRVEYRLRWTGQLEMYMDFYTENPRSYYATVNGSAGQIPKNGKIQIQVVKDAPLPVGIAVVRDHRDGPTINYGSARTPTYATPLNDATDAKAWWQAHRPILAQTSALGPIDPRQRFGDFWMAHVQAPVRIDVGPIETDQPLKPQPNVSYEQVPGPVPQPSFSGFRVVQVANNVIQRIRYVVLADLRQKNFKLDWEPKGLFDSHLTDAVLHGDWQVVEPATPTTPPVPPVVAQPFPGGPRPTLPPLVAQPFPAPPAEPPIRRPRAPATPPPVVTGSPTVRDHRTPRGRPTR